MPATKAVECLQWVGASNGEVPPNALQVGCEEDGRPVFAARGLYRGGLQVGKVARHLGGLVIGFDKKATLIPNYEVLVCDAENADLEWRDAFGPAQSADYEPFEAGYENDGRELFIAKHKDEAFEAVHVGKCGPHLKLGMSYGHQGVEVQKERYQILAYRLT